MTIKLPELPLAAATLQEMYRAMWTIRVFDTRVIEVYRQGLIRGTTHPYVGMEAIAVGACAALGPQDYITSTHRGHGHCIAKGGDIKLMMAELLGKATGYCKGKGGSMHIADLERGMLGANGVVAGSVGIATGAALSAKLRGTDQVTICFFGEGALNQGILHECCNLAAIWKLPVIFLCENNQYAMSARVERFTAGDPVARAQAYGFPGLGADGMDVLEVYSVVSQAVAHARAGQGPSLVVCDSYRYYGHHAGDPLNYRSKEEVEAWWQRDPLRRFGQYLMERGLLTEEEAQATEAEVTKAVDEALEYAKASPDPPLEGLMEDIYA